MTIDRAKPSKPGEAWASGDTASGWKRGEPWTRRAYRNLIYFHEVDRDGHFAAWEQPELFASELRAAFRSLRRVP